MKSAMRSYAALSRNRPPITDCSASIECGGIRRESSCGSEGAFMARIIPASASGQKKRTKNQQKIAEKQLINTGKKGDKKAGRTRLFKLRRRLRDQPADDYAFASATTAITTSTTTSVCRATETLCSPTTFSGPVGIRICAFSTAKPCLVNASAMSKLVTEPNRRPSTPAF